MADRFDETVEKLSKASIKLDAAAEKMSSGGDDKSSASAEDKKEKARRESQNTGYLKSIAEALTGATKGGDDSGSKKSKLKGGLLAGIGSALGGMGIGAGVAMGGLGAFFAGGGYLLKQIAEFDGKAVVENVKHLISINDLLQEVGML